MNEVSVGQTYKEVGARAGRVVRVTYDSDPNTSTWVIIQNLLTLRSVKIKKSRLLNESRFALVSEIGSLAPTIEHEAVAA